jgi:aldehyde:ferredoxin oxidoreductase
MPVGYNGKILHVNLTDGSTWVEEPEENFYRRHLGGGSVGAYYLLKELKPKIDPLSPDNIIIFAPSVITGAPVPGLSRFSVVSKSPLTGGIGESEAGGFWGPELKFAGYDAVVIRGKSAKPVYLYINEGKVELKNAEHLWGKVSGEAESMIREENDDLKIRVAIIGPAGENLIRYACIVNDLHHVNGRTGMGAVMGSKNLKAVAVRGTKKMGAADEAVITEVRSFFNQNYKNNPDAYGLQQIGTSQYLAMCQGGGVLPTRNWKTGEFEEAETITGEHIHKMYFQERKGCYACGLQCKQVIKAEKPYHIDPAYGGPEYESLASLGSYCGIGDTPVVCKANELCNKFTMDTISTGGTISFAMECFENGIIGTEDTGGIELRFGNGEALLKLIEMIAYRQGIGEILAEGSKRAAEKFGKGSEKYAMHVKGQEMPAHDPRFKGMMAIGYAVSTVGADHQRTEHDDCYGPGAPEWLTEQAKVLGLLEQIPIESVAPEKVRMFYYFKLHYGVTASLDICHFTLAPLRVTKLSNIPKLVSAITGWETSLWEIMKAGERKINMFKAFNVREGFGPEDDWLPERMFEGIESGPKKGWKVDRDELREAIDIYYKMMGWDEQGVPTREKLIELDIPWVHELIN